MTSSSQDAPGRRQNKGTAFMVVALILTIIASIVVTLRVYIRVYVNRKFGWDDGLIIFSLASNPLNFAPYPRLTRASFLPSSQQRSTYPRSSLVTVSIYIIYPTTSSAKLSNGIGTPHHSSSSAWQPARRPFAYFCFECSSRLE